MIDYQKLMNWPFEEIQHTISERDTMLYALGIGLGTDPNDRNQLRFVYEKDLLAMPSMASILCYPGNWLKDPRTGVDHLRVMNGGTQFVIHEPLPIRGTFKSTPRVLDIVDKGREKGAVLRLERKVYDARSGAPVCTVTTTSFCRDHGGFGGPASAAEAMPTVKAPDTQPDASVTFATLPNLALIYRLSGDLNPLHVDPDVARVAGFDQPILHGLSTLGVATHALVKACCGYDPARISWMRARYTSFVVPGDTVRTDLWRDESRVRFRCVVPSRNAVVLDYGEASLRV